MFSRCNLTSAASCCIPATSDTFMYPCTLQDTSGALRSVLDYSFATPLRQVQASQVYQAGNTRFRRVVNDLQNGKPVKIVAIGGVATNGTAASSPGINDFFALYVKYLKRAFPNAQIESVRNSAGIAPSAVVSQCLGSYMPSDADLVLLEMTANDAVGMDNSLLDGHNAKAYELLMRGILAGDKQPALILTQVRGAFDQIHTQSNMTQIPAV
eukprot:GHRQ01011971.1.p1 GENE.GHRQ01011971.1~~GHRQ01011971.1.p1  ORF type:complete len:212 (+),score=62.26 GHRQ01011971.1:445-1080(+)